MRGGASTDDLTKRAADPVPSTGYVTGGVSVILRIEAAIVAVGAVTAYQSIHANWMVFAVFFLVPDISMAGYLVGRSIGASLYNATHSYVLPGMTLLTGILLGWETLYPIALIWLAHIGVDRTLGFGLKYSVAFRATHLGFLRSRSKGSVK